MQDALSPVSSSDSAFLRRTMVDCQIRTFDVTDRALLDWMIEVPREPFLPEELLAFAYSDLGLHVACGERGQEQRTLLPPLILARLIQDARLVSTDKVLDVGSSGGYSTALLAGLAGSVTLLDSDSALLARARAGLDSLGLERVRTVLGSLSDGAPDEAPFDAIFVNGAIEANLDALFAQLKEGGRLIAIQYLPGDPTERAGKAVRYEKVNGEVSYRKLFDASAPVLPAFRKVPEFTFY